MFVLLIINKMILSIIFKFLIYILIFISILIFIIGFLVGIKNGYIHMSKNEIYNNDIGMFLKLLVFSGIVGGFCGILSMCVYIFGCLYNTVYGFKKLMCFIKN